MTLEEELGNIDVATLDSQLANININDIQSVTTTPTKTGVDTEAPGFQEQYAAPDVTQAKPYKEPGVLETFARGAEDVGEFLAYPLLEGKKDVSSSVDAVVDTMQATAQGAGATVLGTVQLLNDGLRAIGISVDDKPLQKKIDNVNKEITNYVERYKLEGDFFNASSVGRLAPEFATLPMAIKSRVLAPMIEGFLAAGNTRGTGADEAAAATTGMATWAGITAVGFALDVLLPSSAKSVLKALQKKHDISDEAVEDLYSRKKNLINLKDTAAARVTAVVDSLGEAGKHYKDVASYGVGAAKNMTRIANEHKALLQDLASKSRVVTKHEGNLAKNFAEYSDAHSKGIDFAYKEFGAMKDALPTKPIANPFFEGAKPLSSMSVKTTTPRGGDELLKSVTNTKVDGGVKTVDVENLKGTTQTITEKFGGSKGYIPALEDALVTTRNRITNLLSKPNVNAQDLADTLVAINSFPKKTQGLHDVKALKTQVQKLLKDNTSPLMYQRYEANQKLYGSMKTLQDSFIHRAVTKANVQTLAKDPTYMQNVLDSLRSNAVTEESTPPETPTITRV